MARASKIRSVLEDAGLVTTEEWSAACADQGHPTGNLVRQQVLSESALLEALGQAAAVAPVDLSRVQPDTEAVQALPREVCEEHSVLPLAKNGDLLTVAVNDPFDVLLLDDLQILSGARIRPVVSHSGAIEEALSRIFDSGAEQIDELLDEVDGGDLTIGAPEELTPDLSLANEGDGDEVPAVRLVNWVLKKALKDKASDIHIEPGEQQGQVRFRVDGRMYVVAPLKMGLMPALISRLKILANLDIAERMGPQDGKFQLRFEGRRIDFRLSTLPVVGGEKAVMRILDSSGVAKSLAKLEYEDRCLQDLQETIASPYGMVLVTGPTGSGKSTTLYASVREVASPEINVVTVEDPVEYRMDGINQVPVNPKRGLDFAGALRSILRQDPDVVLVGEIRDKETAEIAIKAALTGHLVLSTLHTNDAASSVTRLVDMGIDPFMVSSSILCVAAQRLARVLCPHCRQPAQELPREEYLALGFTEEEADGELEMFSPNPDGCSRCQGGYKGRFAILETLRVDHELKRMIVEGRSAADIKDKAVENGMLTLRRVGLLNAMRGKTSLEEVMRVTLGD
jgi:type IV pilus assembly protein PilB